MGTAMQWTLYGGRVFEPVPFGIMGIVNITPDSFYDGGAPDTAREPQRQAARLLREGADMLDLGAESSRPGARPVAAETECARLMPVLCGLHAAHPCALISVDTYHAATAARLLATGYVHVLHDISACASEPELLDVVAQYRPGYVLMHAQGRPDSMQRAPRYTSVVEEVLDFFAREMHRLTAAGLPEDRIVLDPGIGFGKRLEHNMALLRAAHVFQERLGRPVLMGLSMKSVFGDLLGLPVERRGQATQTATAMLMRDGIRLHRVHDVAATAQTLRLTAAWQG